MNAARVTSATKKLAAAPIDDENGASTPEPEPATPSTPALTGYAADVQFLASRYKQGGRTVYSLDLSPVEISSLVTPPDVASPSPGNRAIRPAHADAFAKYVRNRDDWVSPSLMLRAPKSFGFDTDREMAGIQFGTLSIARRSLGDLHIVDGQHRILGFMRAEKGIADDLDKQRSALATARRVEKDGKAEKDIRAKIADLEKQRNRLEEQRVNVQITVEADPVRYKQIFFDINDNALGITGSVKARFDSHKVVNRALALTMDHPLLTGRVDPEGDRISGASPYMMGAKHVAEIARTVNVGLDGRVSRRQEEEFKEKDLAATTKDFFSLLQESFPQMQALTLGQLLPADLRKSSLLGSVLFVRVLGGVYHDLGALHAFDRDAIVEFMHKLAAHVGGPVYEGSIWTEQLPELFSPGAMAPRGRRQDLKNLKDTLVGWAIDKPTFLDQEPAPRPVAPEPEVDPEEGAGYLGFDIPETK